MDGYQRGRQCLDSQPGCAVDGSRDPALL
jgi:hypothetical protein